MEGLAALIRAKPPPVDRPHLEFGPAGSTGGLPYIATSCPLGIHLTSLASSVYVRLRSFLCCHIMNVTNYERTLNVTFDLCNTFFRELMKIGEKISKLRESLGFSQDEFGAKIGLGRNYLSRIENGHVNPTYETLEKIASALGGRFDFIAEKGSEEPAKPADDIGPLSHNEKALILAYREISSNDKRRAVMMMAKAFGK